MGVTQSDVLVHHGLRFICNLSFGLQAAQLLARLARAAATGADRALLGLARREWVRRRDVKSGSVQYLIFQKQPA